MFNGILKKAGGKEMKFSEDVYIKAEIELKKRRENAEQLAEKRRRQILNKHPELLEIENIIRNYFI